MNDRSKTKQELIQELASLRQGIAEREHSESGRKQEDEALRESEQRLASIYNTVGDVIFCLSVEPAGQFRFVSVNSAFLKVTGLSQEMVVGRNVNEIIPEPSLAMVLGKYRQTIAEKTIVRWEEISDYPTGRLTGVVSIAPVFDDKGTCTHLVGSVHDITERKQLEEDLRLSEENFRRSLENSPLGVRIVTIEGETIYANREILDIYGYDSIEELKRTPLKNRYTPESYAEFLIRRDKRRQNIEAPSEYEISIVRKDGEVRHLQVFRKKILWDGEKQFQVLYNDITERKLAEEVIRESESKFRTLFESASDAIFLVDQNIFIDCNLKTLEMFGCTREQIIGQPPYRFSPEVQPDGRNSTEQAQEKNNTVLKGQPQFFEWKHCRYDGTLFDAEISLNFISDMGKNYIQAICRDITERKQTEEYLKKYREHLEELVRERTIKLESSNKELEAFSYSASHDLRAPLRSIDGFSQALLEDCEDKLDMQGKDYLIRIRAATKRMADLIEDLLQLSRLTRTEMNIEKINLTRIARSVIDELQKSHPQRHVEIKIGDGLEDTADSRLMRITLENLLGNAWKFTEKQVKAVIEFGCTEEGGKKVYFIRDNGVGFDMAYVDKLFAPFQRLHNEEEFPGTGIGLALVRRIIHRHGGKVWTEGQTDKGATFYFSLNEK